MKSPQNIKQIPRSIFRKLKPILETGQRWLQIRPIRIFIQAAILTFTIYYLIRSYQSVELSQLDLTLRFTDLVWSFLITMLALFLGGFGWWLTLRTVGQTLRLGEALRIHSVSNLAKYIPGYAWQLLSKGYLTRKNGVSTKIIGVAMTLELTLIFITGMWLIILLFPPELTQSINSLRGTTSVFPFVRYILLAVVTAIPILLPRIIKKLDPQEATIGISPFYLLLASFSILVGWALFGIAFWLIGNAIFPIPLDTVPVFIFSLAVSFLIGLLIIVIPASIGVRESLMVFLLGNLLTAPVAVIVAAMSRIILTLSELLFAGIILIFARISRNGGNDLPIS